MLSVVGNAVLWRGADSHLNTHGGRVDCESRCRHRREVREDTLAGDVRACGFGFRVLKCGIVVRERERDVACESGSDSSIRFDSEASKAPDGVGRFKAAAVCAGG